MSATANVAGRARGRRWPWRLCRVLGVAALGLVALHLWLVLGSHMTPPSVAAQGSHAAESRGAGELRVLGASYLRKRGAITELGLVGDPEQIGHAHAQLARAEAVAIEGAVHEQFAHYVPWALLRWTIVDVARWRFRSLDADMGLEQRRELASYALAFEPDPFEVGMDTFQRLVLLSSLYDVMLSFERSPLLGCSSFVLRGGASAGGHTLLARNFDFEGPQVLDDRKAVFLMRERGRIGYASVSWPGFVGVTTGMNAAGLGVVVHGARARSPQTSGDPLALTVRELLGSCVSTRQAVELATRRRPMVSHLLLLADAAGDVVVMERAPGEPAFVRRPEGDRIALTNHFEGPWANDPANLAVQQQSSTVPRRQRLDEILSNLRGPSSVERAVEILRDKLGPGGEPLALGDRRAIDALIATHSVVMDLSERSLWVGEGPHVAGRFVRFELDRLLDPGFEPSPSAPEPVVSIAADPILEDGRLEAWTAAGAPHPPSR